MCGLLWRLELDLKTQGGGYYLTYVRQLNADKVKWEISFNNKGDKIWNKINRIKSSRRDRFFILSRLRSK